MDQKIFPIFALPIFFTTVLTGCKHDPLIPGASKNKNSSNENSGVCNPDIVYFERDLLPLFISNCAMSGCHDPATAEDGVILNNYENILNTGDVRPWNPGNSDIYEKITESDPEERMPPAPAKALSPEQISMVRTWILQGAKDLTCRESDNCDTSDISFSGTVEPVIAGKCQGCHSGNTPSAGLSLEGYTNIKSIANSGKLSGVINHAGGFPKMPKGGNKLPDCEIAKIEAWINQGMVNN